MMLFFVIIDVIIPVLLLILVEDIDLLRPQRTAVKLPWLFVALRNLQRTSNSPSCCLDSEMSEQFCPAFVVIRAIRVQMLFQE